MITAPNGDIFVSDGHNGQSPDPPEGSTGRILKFDSEGNFIKEWGEIGFRPGQFRTPHAMEFDSQGRLYVADRGNHRIQVFDQEGELLEIYTQYSRVSGLFITADDTLYAIDSESQETNHYGWMNGVRIGPSGEDRVTGFVPPHIPAESSPRGKVGLFQSGRRALGALAGAPRWHGLRATVARTHNAAPKNDEHVNRIDAIHEATIGCASPGGWDLVGELGHSHAGGSRRDPQLSRRHAVFPCGTT